MLSINKITAAKADKMSRYYGKETEALAVEKGITVEEADSLLQRDRAEEIAEVTGRDVGEVLREWRAEDHAEAMAAAHAKTTGYYSVKQNDRSRLRFLRGGEGAATEKDLKDMFHGRNEGGQSLRDPNKLELEKLARMEGLSVQEDLPGEYLDAFRAGMNPETAEPLGADAKEYQAKIYAYKEPKNPEATVTSADLTFSAAKTVSLLVATSSEERREEILAMQEEAVEAAISHAEEMGLFSSLRGKKTDGNFIHATVDRAITKTELSSRAHDPQIHTHTLISAYVLGEDGRRTSVDMQPVYGASKYLGTVYRRHLEQSLTRKYGIQFDRDLQTGVNEVRGVSRAEIEHYSSRQREIVETLAEMAQEDATITATVERNREQFVMARERVRDGGKREPDVKMATMLNRYDAIQQERESGHTHAKRRQAAVLSSRSNKAELSEDAQFAAWSQDATLTEIGERLNQYVTHQQERGRAKSAVTGMDLPDLVEAVRTELVYSDAMFTEKDLRLFVAANLSSRYDETQQAQIADKVLDSLGVKVAEGKQRVGGWAIAKNHAQDRYTTSEIIDRERNIVETAGTLASQKAKGLKPAWKVQKAAKRDYNLNPEQSRFLSQILDPSERLNVGEGPAGSGKTTMLTPAVSALREQGYTTICLATRAKTASDLMDTGAERSYSLEKFLMDQQGGVIYEGKYVRGVAKAELDLRDKLNVELHKARGDLKKAAGNVGLEKRIEARIERVENDLAAWQARRDEEKKLWEEYKQRADLVKWTPMPEALAQVHRERMAEIKAVSPYAKITFEEDARKRHYLVDEAGMATNAHVEKLLTFIKEKDPDAIVTLVGDSKQTESVEVGTAFDLIKNRVGYVELTQAVRPNNEWEARVQEEWHALRSAESGQQAPHVAQFKANQLLQDYKEHDRIDVVGREAVMDAVAAGELPADGMRFGASQLAQQQAAAEYLSIRDRGASGCVLAGTWREVSAINDDVQAELLRRGEVDGSKSIEAVVDIEKGLTQQIHPGDMVAVRANQNKQSLQNGHLGKVTRVTSRGLYVRVADEYGNSAERFLTKKALQDEGASLGYAQTIASSQGITVDEAVLVMNPESKMTDRENAYVGMTRGRESNRVILVSDSPSNDEQVEAAFANTMLRSGRNESPLEAWEQAQDQDAVKEMQETFAADGLPLEEDEAKTLLEDTAAQAAARRAQELREARRTDQVPGKQEAIARNDEKLQQRERERQQQLLRSQGRQREMAI